MTVEYEQDGHVVVVRLNRPESANAIDGPTSKAFGEAFQRAAGDDSVRAVILTGAGERHFCAGMDLKAFAGGWRPEDDGTVALRHGHPKPVIAAVNGTAVGGGFELVLACDLVVAAEHARFGLPEVRRGLLAGGGGTDLPRRIPLPLALEIGLTGEPIDAAHAERLGLVNRVVPLADLMPEAQRLAALIARNGPLAVRATKKLMWEAAGRTGAQRIADEGAAVFASADAVEGATAFAEKRDPVWQGR